MRTEHNIYIGDREGLAELKDDKPANESVMAAATGACGVFATAIPRNRPPARPPRRHLAQRRGPSVKRVSRITERS
jgi:hypothetical protein